MDEGATGHRQATARRACARCGLWHERRGAHGRVVGVDINPAMLAVARNLPTGEGAPIEWREESAIATTLPDASFDLVLCQQGLQFFPDRAAGVREMRRVLKPGGRAVVACWQSLDHIPAFKAMVHAEARETNEPVASFAKPWSLGDAGELRGCSPVRALNTSN